MKIADIISFIEAKAHPSLQESYDNAGLITGNANWECSGIICSLDAIEEVVKEAIVKKCNLIVAHHPIIFTGLKKINGNNYVERTIITAIKNDIAIYAVHTNLDNILNGVNGQIATMLGLKNVSILQQKENTLKKLFTFVPVDKAEKVRQALFEAGGGHIGNYSECSFNTEGMGTFKAGNDTQPYVGKKNELHAEKEIKMEVVFPAYLESTILKALLDTHPYQEVAFDVIPLSNAHAGLGAGIIGELPNAVDEKVFLNLLKEVFKVPFIRHTSFLNKPISSVALCGGAGSFLIFRALAAKADIYISADFKYHEFFNADKKMLIADIGHYESEQYTINLLQEFLEQKFPTFAVLKTEVKTNPVHYF